MTDPKPLSRKSLHRNVSLLLATLIALRVLFLILLPHIDTSESRYAEIARKMVETGDWITPQFDYGIPFWAKPPLSMWISALGIELFGANEFGSRIFIFIAALALLAIVAKAVQREADKTSGLVAATLLCVLEREPLAVLAIVVGAAGVLNVMPASAAATADAMFAGRRVHCC